MMLDFCSAEAHNTRAILLTLDWNNAVRQGNKFTQQEFKQTKHLLGTTNAGACEQRTPNRKPEISTRMGVQPNIYMPAKVPAKYPGKPRTQFKPITSNSSPKIKPMYPSTPLGCNVRLITPKYWDLPQYTNCMGAIGKRTPIHFTTTGNVAWVRTHLRGDNRRTEVFIQARERPFAILWDELTTTINYEDCGSQYLSSVFGIWI